MGFSLPLKELYESEEPIPFLGTITVCSECYSLVLPDYHVAHALWHSKVVVRSE